MCPPSPAGYAPSDMPVKAKRSTYNYSLPITVKKTSKGLGLPCRAGAGKEGHPDCGRAGASRGVTPGPCWPAHPRVGGGGRGAGEIPPCIPDPCRGPLAASQLVTMHDLKQGLGPSGSATAQKSSPNKYKLKVGVRRQPVWARVRGGWSSGPSPGQAGPRYPYWASPVTWGGSDGGCPPLPVPSPYSHFPALPPNTTQDVSPRGEGIDHQGTSVSGRVLDTNSRVHCPLSWALRPLWPPGQGETEGCEPRATADHLHPAVGWTRAALPGLGPLSTATQQGSDVPRPVVSCSRPGQESPATEGWGQLYARRVRLLSPQGGKPPSGTSF